MRRSEEGFGSPARHKRKLHNSRSRGGWHVSSFLCLVQARLSIRLRRPKCHSSRSHGRVDAVTNHLTQFSLPRYEAVPLQNSDGRSGPDISPSKQCLKKHCPALSYWYDRILPRPIMGISPASEARAKGQARPTWLCGLTERRWNRA